MNTYLINTTLGMFIVMGDNPIKAWIKYCIQESELGDSFLERSDLLDRGYTKIEHTQLSNVFLLIK